MSDVKLCKDCEYYGGRYDCRSPKQSRSLITGNVFPASCADNRYVGRCGREGAWFVPRVTVEEARGSALKGVFKRLVQSLQWQNGGINNG